MDLATYLRTTETRPAAFARRIGVAASTLSGWLNDPRRGPGRANLVAIERETNGQVTARDFAPCEESHERAVPLHHDAASPA